MCCLVLQVVCSVYDQMTAAFWCCRQLLRLVEEISNQHQHEHQLSGVNISEDDYYTSNVSALLHDFYSNFTERSLKKDPYSWSYPGALFYAATIITTIGYGNIACETLAGRILTILYALVGIPLFLAIMSRLGGRLVHAAQRISCNLRKMGKMICGKQSGDQPSSGKLITMEVADCGAK